MRWKWDFFDVLTSIDVAAHELATVCEKTANLKESGAMNEGFLIFGELV
jgi:Zn-dependent metalloprotease